MWNNPRVSAAVDCRKTDLGHVREELVVGKTCEGKPSSCGSKVIQLSHTQRVEPSSKPLSPHTASIPLAAK